MRRALGDTTNSASAILFLNLSDLFVLPLLVTALVLAAVILVWGLKPDLRERNQVQTLAA
jgi:hypothetical protein